jgi:hypothetical protein
MLTCSICRASTPKDVVTADDASYACNLCHTTHRRTFPPAEAPAPRLGFVFTKQEESGAFTESHEAQGATWDSVRSGRIIMIEVANLDTGAVLGRAMKRDSDDLIGCWNVGRTTRRDGRSEVIAKGLAYHRASDPNLEATTKLVRLYPEEKIANAEMAMRIMLQSLRVVAENVPLTPILSRLKDIAEEGGYPLHAFTILQQLRREADDHQWAPLQHNRYWAQINKLLGIPLGEQMATAIKYDVHAEMGLLPLDEAKTLAAMI